MLLQSPIRLPSQPLKSAEPVRLRRDSNAPREDVGPVRGAVQRSSIADQAVVVHFGSQALGLARSQPPPADVTLADEEGAAPTGAPDSTTAEAGATGTAPAGDTAAGTPPSGSAGASTGELSDEDQAEVDQMKRRDREVRTHEQAHKTAGGSYTGSMRLTYQMGPDGKRYASEGSVPIDVSPVAGDPAATLRKMEVVARAANAPASPSGADRAVAAQAMRNMQQARAQLAAERYARARELVPGA